MLDITKYEHHNLDLPNIIGATKLEQKADYEGHTFSIDVRIKEFIHSAAMKFPMWRFVGRYPATNWAAKQTAFRTFVVYEGREDLGEIHYEYNHKNDVMFGFSNNRISDKRQRGSSMRTKDTKKALKIMATLFGAKTVVEQMREAIGKGMSSMGDIHQDRSRDFSRSFNYLTAGLIDHVFANWEQYKSIAVANGHHSNHLEKLPEQYEQYSIARDVWAKTSKESGVFVTIHGNDYAVLKGTEKAEGTPQILSSDSLPEWIRRKVGMLKLVEDEHFLRDVGYRISGTAFFVINQEDQA